MVRILIFCVAVSILACVAVGGAVATGAGPGIEVNTTTDAPEPETYAQEIDADTQLVEWSYNDEREGFELRFETNSSTRITLTEAVQFSEGAGSGRIYQQRLPKGTSDVFVKVPRRGGQSAVTMTTPSSIEENRYSYVSTGQTTPDRPPITYGRVQLIVLLTAMGSAGMAFGIVKRRREDEQRDWRRVL